MAPFDNFLTGKGLECKLKPFRGNRFNILFEDGGAVFYHHDHMTEFILKSCPTPNLLIRAVMADLAENVYLAGARALGILNYRLTTPLWSVLESDIHIFDMNEKYQFIVDKLNAWTVDPSELLQVPAEDDELGSVLAPSVDDEVSKALYSPDISEEISLLTSEALRLMCAAMTRVSERMLADHLTGGRWDKPSQELKEQTRTAPTTNIASEHDFGQLDRLKREKPNANTIAYEALIMYVTNRTSDWFSQLPQDKQHQYITLSRKTAPSVRAAFYEKRKKHQEDLTAQRVEKERLKQEKEMKQQKEKETLTKQLGEFGGLWTGEEVDDKLNEVPTGKHKEALSIQLKFRHKVLLQSSQDSSMWYMSKGGKQKATPELVVNLKAIIHQNHVISPSCDESTSGSKSYRSIQERRKLLAESVSKIHSQTTDDRIKLLSKRKQRESQRRLDSPTKRCRSSIQAIPDFVGRRVEHLYEDELTGAEEWYEGTVVQRVTSKRTKDPLKVLYEIHYEDGDQAEINLAEDFVNGELRFIDELVTGGDSDVPLAELDT